MSRSPGAPHEPTGRVVDRAEIERRLPHAGTMCLIDAVDTWSADDIVCRAAAARTGHPLAASSRDPSEASHGSSSTLQPVTTIEHAAQAVALHASLVDDATAPRAGMLATLREVNLSSGPVRGELVIAARLVTRSDAGCLYAFDVRDAQGACSSGRLMIAFTP
jgi:predicted hotdog family 3-hydroxylacyl-ACP dehydratase